MKKGRRKEGELKTKKRKRKEELVVQQP